MRVLLIFCDHSELARNPSMRVNANRFMDYAPSLVALSAIRRVRINPGEDLGSG